MLDQALRNNPDLRVAAAKLAEAEAELSRIRLQVVQKVVQAYQAAEAAQALADFHLKEVKRLEELVAKGAVSATDLDEKQKLLAAAKTQAAAAEADLAYLLGKSAAKEVRDTSETLLYLNAIERARHAWEKALPLNQVRERVAADVAGPMAERLRKALESPMNVNFDDALLSEVISQVRELWSIPIIEKTETKTQSLNVKLKIGNISLGALLQLLEDLAPGNQFVVRDYGLLMVPEGKIPPGALLLSDFRKLRPEKPDTAPAKPKAP
jgi:hypothetical protein